MTINDEWQSLLDAFNNPMDGPMSGHIPLDNNSHSNHLSHLDQSQEHHLHNTSHPVLPTTPIWEDTPIPTTKEEMLSQEPEAQQMMPYQYTPTTPEQTQPTDQAWEILDWMENIPATSVKTSATSSATSSIMKVDTESHTLDSDHWMKTTHSSMSMKNQLGGDGNFSQNSEELTYQELLPNGERGLPHQTEVSMMMSAANHPRNLMITTASMTEMIQEEEEQQCHRTGYYSGSREFLSPTRKNNYTELDEEEESESKNRDEERKFKRTENRDKSRWEEYVEKDEAYREKVSRELAVEKEIIIPIRKRMKKDYKMMRGKRFDKTIAYYWGKEIDTKRHVSILAYKIFGYHWRQLAVNTYRLYRGIEEDLYEEEPKPREIRRMNRKDLQLENQRRRTLKALNKRK